MAKDHTGPHARHISDFRGTNDGVPEEYGAKRSRDMDSMMARIAEFEAESERDDMNFTEVLKDKFNPWRVSEFDILSVALLGPPSRSISSQRGFLPESADGLSPDEITASVLEWNGIQKRGLEAICVKLSLECGGSFIAAQRYVEACDNGEFQATKLDDRLDIMSTVLKTLDGFLLNSAGAHRSTDVTQRLLEIYGLLTSWDLGQGLAQPPMRRFYRKDYRTHLLYLMCLVRLGAFRTMWYQWHMDLEKPPDWAVVTSSKSKSNRTRTDGEDGGIPCKIRHGNIQELGGTEIQEILAGVYAKALLRWRGATNHAEELLRSVEFNNASDNFEQNRQLEIETIIRLGESRSEAAPADDPRRASPEDYEGEIAEIFSDSDIRDALAGLQTLLSRIVASNDSGHEATPRGSTSIQGPGQRNSSSLDRIS
ncbi:hypothetical protein DL769_006363 [Monosporascus sp. CRB-8-3]|nr:hypothetical protein DL769_006363 [Monosporascus sp. CRB-8-3]